MRNWERWIDRNVITVIYALASIAAAIIGVALTVLAFVEFAHAIAAFFGDRGPAAEGASSDARMLEYRSSQAGDLSGAMTIAGTLKAVELLFLAPLPFIVVVSTIRYLSPFFTNRDDPAADRRMMTAKAFMASLMVGVLATDLVRRAISETGLTYEPAIGGVLAIIAIGAFFYLLEHIAHERGAHLPAASSGVNDDSK